MVSLDDVLASNAQIPHTFPKRLVAVFAGATSGIGETTLKTLVKYAVEPKIYLFARNPASAARVLAECRRLNPGGEYELVKVDLSSIQHTDGAYETVKRKEKLVNLVILSSVMLSFDRRPAQATPLARVVNVMLGTREGNIDINDLAAWNLPLYRTRPHVSSLHTFELESLAQQASSVSFVHSFPGAVYTSSHRSVPGFRGWLLFLVLELVHFLSGKWLFIPNGESGERHLFLATSALYPPVDGEAKGLSQDGSKIATKGTDGKALSGVYTVDWNGEGPGESAVVALQRLREKGTREVVWQHFIEQWNRAVGNTLS